MNSDPLLREQMDAELAARLARMTARNPRTSTGTSTPPSSPPPATRQLASTPPPPPPGATPVRKKRRHPARHSRSAALALSFITTSGLAYAFASTDNGASATITAPAGIVTPTTPTTAPTVSTAAAPATATAPAVTTAPTTAVPAPATPTVVNGESFGNRYGDVQVQATFAPDGSLTNVDVLQVPYRDGKSVAINDYAVPHLNSEALTAQSANVHTVSGATYTSIGYEQSLQSAIDAARANGITTIA